MNVQRSLIQEPMIYECELGQKVVESIKSIYCTKDDGTADNWTVIWLSKKFHSGYIAVPMLRRQICAVIWQQL